MATAVFPLTTMCRGPGALVDPTVAERLPKRQRRLAMGRRTIRAATRGGLPDPEATVRVPLYDKTYPKEDYDSESIEEIAFDSDAGEEAAITVGPSLLPIFKATLFGTLLNGPTGNRLSSSLVKKFRTQLFITHQPQGLCITTAAVLLDVQLYNLAVLDLLVHSSCLTRPPALVVAFRRASERLVELLRRLLEAYGREGAIDASEYTELSRLRSGVLLLTGKVCQTARKLKDST